MNIQAATPLLGGLSPAVFMREYWGKKPLLIRQAMPGFQAPLSRSALFALAAREGVESRLIQQQGRQWTLQHGPFSRRALPALATPQWTLLVQGVDLYQRAARDLLDRFRFVPDVRLDDLMISYASDGGGVGAHQDSYDVFLLQAQGKRRWRIAAPGGQTLREDVPVKILKHFKAEQEHVLEPGDMLYLPPLWAHEGVALGECMTCSIGFRAPGQAELGRELLLRLADHHEADGLFGDEHRLATSEPGRMPTDLLRFAKQAVKQACEEKGALALALGEYLTEPKALVSFEPLSEPYRIKARLLPALGTRMLYGEGHVFVNGESWACAGADEQLLRQLVDRQQLLASQVRSASRAFKGLIQEWVESGWLLWCD